MVATDIKPESAISRSARRAAGVVSLLGLGLAISGGLAGYRGLVGPGVVVFVVLPWATMIAHLALTGCMSKDEKAMWRRELPWSPRSFIALWAYLFANDLGERARGFGPYRL
jgi:hypothetical protein